MEAITIAGLAAVAVGGYYTLVDVMNDLGLHRRTVQVETKRLPVSRRYVVTSQTGIKKMAGMHV
jgi:hypothetical protein